MELRHLRYFLVLAEELNFTRAAERLMIAQPPLSRQIRDLEEELGAPLFVRQHHSVRLTDEGVLFRDYASRIIALSEQSVSDIRNMRSGLQGTLYLAEVEGKGPRLMAEWIAGFSRLHPKVQFSVWNGNSDEVVNRVRKGLSDAALIMEPHDPEGIQSHLVYSEPWIAMFPADHPLAASDSDTVSMRVVTAYELCRNGVGVAIYPAAAADIVKDRGSVRIRTISDPGIRASYVLIYSSEHPLHTLTRRFVEYILAQQEKEIK